MNEHIKYRLIYKGEVSVGENVETVKKKIAGLYKCDVEKVNHLFSGKRKIIAKDLKSCEKNTCYS